jgi:hypothetical protein
MELTAMGAALFEDTKYTYFAFGLPTERYGTLAFSGSLVSSGDFERTTMIADLGETFSEKAGFFGLSYAIGNPRWSGGLTLKSVTHDVGGAKGNGLGADLGVYFRPHKFVSLGAGAQNILRPEVTLDEEPEELATSLRAGVALRFFNNRLLVVSDVVDTEHMDTSLRSGLEFWAWRNMAFRGGYDTEKEQYSLGLGVRLDNWQFDYAFIDQDLGTINILSATLRFGVPYGVKIHRDRELFSPSGSDKEVTFAIDTAVRGRVESWELLIMNEEGQVVRTLQGNGEPPEGITWQGDDDQGRLVTDGTYYAQIAILDSLGQEWDYETSVDVLGFQDRTRTPIRVEINGGGEPSTEGKNR